MSVSETFQFVIMLTGVITLVYKVTKTFSTGNNFFT